MAFFGTDYTGYTDVGDFCCLFQFPNETEKQSAFGGGTALSRTVIGDVGTMSLYLY